MNEKRDRSKNPLVGDTVGEGNIQKTVLVVRSYTIIYRDHKGEEHKTTPKSWRDMLRKRGLK